MGMYCQLALQYLLKAIRESAHLPGCRSLKKTFFFFFLFFGPLLPVGLNG